MTARLTVLLGAGGVGKTTLAAGYAIALARSGRRVGLLGIDPSRRLQDALGVALSDREQGVRGEPNLSAAILAPQESLRRWAGEDLPSDSSRLVANAFFVALADRLAAATDVIAAVRAAEWLEHDPALDELVVDTAPGLNAIEFLQRPRALAAFLQGRLIGWLRKVAAQPRDDRFGASLRGGARRVVGALARIAGTRLVLDLADFVALIERPLERMLARVDAARAWIEGDDARIVLVTAVREDAASTAQRLAEALFVVGLSPRATVVNRTLPEELGRELEIVAPPSDTQARALVRYARAHVAMQSRVLRAVAPLAPATFSLPAVRGLGDDGRLDALATLGEHLLEMRTADR